MSLHNFAEKKRWWALTEIRQPDGSPFIQSVQNFDDDTVDYCGQVIINISQDELIIHVHLIDSKLNPEVQPNNKYRHTEPYRDDRIRYTENRPPSTPRRIHRFWLASDRTDLQFTFEFGSRPFVPDESQGSPIICDRCTPATPKFQE